MLVNGNVHSLTLQNVNRQAETLLNLVRTTSVKSFEFVRLGLLPLNSLQFNSWNAIPKNPTLDIQIIRTMVLMMVLSGYRNIINIQLTIIHTLMNHLHRLKGIAATVTNSYLLKTRWFQCKAAN